MSAGADSEKYASVYPLPGGVEQYFDSLIALLRYARDNFATPDALANLMSETFSTPTGQIVVNGYIGVVSRMGLWTQQDSVLRLTSEGTMVVTKAESDPAEARRIVLRNSIRGFSGYDALFQLLLRGPQSMEDINQHLKEALATNWKTKNQSGFRVNWLRSLGYARKDGREYLLTQEGRDVYESMRGKATPEIESAKALSPVETTLPPLAKRATEIANRLDRLAVAGGDGKEFEEATEAAFKFLGFETQLISGPGNPDVLATAMMGEKSYRILIDSKSRTSGVVSQNDVNVLVLDKQKLIASADYTAVVGADFAGGQLEEFATKHHVRLLTTAELRELLLAHAESVFPLDVLQPLFRGGGATDESVLSEILASAEGKSEVTRLARSVFEAVKEFQANAGTINADSLFYILKCEHPLATIKLILDFLKSDLIGALGESERGSLFTRVSPTTLTNKLSQITRTMDLSHSAQS